MIGRPEGQEIHAPVLQSLSRQPASRAESSATCRRMRAQWRPSLISGQIAQRSNSAGERSHFAESARAAASCAAAVARRSSSVIGFGGGTSDCSLIKARRIALISSGSHWPGGRAAALRLLTAQPQLHCAWGSSRLTRASRRATALLSRLTADSAPAPRSGRPAWPSRASCDGSRPDPQARHPRRE